MTESNKYPTTPSRNTEEIRENYNSDLKEMRAKAASAKIAARQKRSGMHGRGLRLRRFR